MGSTSARATRAPSTPSVNMPTPVRAPNRGVASSATRSGSLWAAASASCRRGSELFRYRGVDLGEIDDVQAVEVAPVLQAAGEDGEEERSGENLQPEHEQRGAEDDARRLVEGPRATEEPPADEHGGRQTGAE